MSEVNWADLANTKAKDVTPPPLLPAGHYICQHAGPMGQKKAQSGNMAMSFPFKIVAPGDDIDQAALADAGGIPDKAYALDFWMSVDARWRFTNFTAAQGIDDELNLIQQAEALISENKPFLIEVKHEPVRDSNPVRYRMVFDNPAALP